MRASRLRLCIRPNAFGNALGAAINDNPASRILAERKERIGDGFTTQPLNPARLSSPELTLAPDDYTAGTTVSQNTRTVRDFDPNNEFDNYLDNRIGSNPNLSPTAGLSQDLFNGARGIYGKVKSAADDAATAVSDAGKGFMLMAHDALLPSGPRDEIPQPLGQAPAANIALAKSLMSGNQVGPQLVPYDPRAQAYSDLRFANTMEIGSLGIFAAGAAVQRMLGRDEYSIAASIEVGNAGFGIAASVAGIPPSGPISVAPRSFNGPFIGEINPAFADRPSGPNKIAIEGDSDFIGPSLIGQSSRLVPGGGLQVHEDAGGHLLFKHVGQSEQSLIDRLIAEPGIRGSSSFYDRATAEDAVSLAIDSNQAKIAKFLSSPKNKTVIEYTAPYNVGISVTPNTSNASQVPSARVILVRDPSQPTGYKILTGFPIP